ncbi:MAG: helix-turn-helix domain-containing protein [Arenibacter latericius]|nr:helix-turn-helix domain-containing protein [Arenibacter latericius]
MARNTITRVDLKIFKMELLSSIKELLNDNETRMMKKEWLRSTQVMDMLKISMSTLQTLRINGTLPFTKIGGLIFYEAGEIEKVLTENSVNLLKEKR